jgi:membrane associated rhomboid family serine protease
MSYRRVNYDNLTPIWIIMIINLVVFIATIVSNKVIFFLGLSPSTFLEQPWTIVTSMFTHGGLWHILINMLMLYFYGSYLSQLIGNKSFLIIYFLGGLLGNIFYLLLSFNPYSIVIGASGAVFALGGALAVLTPKVKVYIFPIPVPMDLWIAVIGGFLVLTLVPGIAWQAHLGGLVFGLLAGYYFRKRRRILF